VAVLRRVMGAEVRWWLFATLRKHRDSRPGDSRTVRVREPGMDDVIRLPSRRWDDAGGGWLVL